MYCEGGAGRWSRWAGLGVMLTLALVAARVEAAPARLAGQVASADGGLGGYDVTLYRTRGRQGSVPLGRDVTEVSGRFAIRYETAGDADGVLYLVARRGRVALATVLTGSPSPLALVAPVRPTEVVINERTTVAVGFALAQFLGAATSPATWSACATPPPWSATWSTSATGKSPVLGLAPNGTRTSTLATFNSLANLVAGCVAGRARAPPLLDAAPGARARAAPETLHAVANIARNPWRNVDAAVPAGDQGGRSDYTPALTRRPTPGRSRSSSWATAGSTAPATSPSMPGQCMGPQQLHAGRPEGRTSAPASCVRFTPTGQTLSRRALSRRRHLRPGFGITLRSHGPALDRQFRLQSPVCAEDAQGRDHNSVSMFGRTAHPCRRSQGLHRRPDLLATGHRLGPARQHLDRQLRQQQRHHLPERRSEARAQPARPRLGVDKPFDIAIDGRGRAWVTGNDSENVAIIGRDGSGRSAGRFDQPMGIASDGRATCGSPIPRWSTCPARTAAVGPQIWRLDHPDHPTAGSRPASPFTGGGVTSPWGVAVDGNDRSGSPISATARARSARS